MAYEDDDVVVFPAPEQAPTNRGFSMLVAKRHIPDLHALPERMMEPVMRGLQIAGSAVRSACEADGLTIRQNNGPPGQHHLHLHFHLVPRHCADGHDGFVRRALDPVPPITRERQAGLIAEAIRSATGTPSGGALPAVADLEHEVYRDDDVVIAVARAQRRGNRGEMIVMLRRPGAGLATMSGPAGTSLLSAVRRCSIAVQKVYGASGTTLRLHDGPPGQELPHVGWYVIPRHLDDRFLDQARMPVDAAERRAQAGRAAAALATVMAASPGAG